VLCAAVTRAINEQLQQVQSVTVHMEPCEGPRPPPEASPGPTKARPPRHVNCDGLNPAQVGHTAKARHCRPLACHLLDIHRRASIVRGAQRCHSRTRRQGSRWDESDGEATIKETIEETMGAAGHNRLDASARTNVYGLSGTDRPDDGAQRRVAQGNGVCYPHDPVLHQPCGKGSLRNPSTKARARETNPAASSRG
jgi:hypothetical protein